ncbi:MAG: hypothetical protein IJ437_06205 [Clostridia bacterium]|nr:hypothetical protein [Clostridia bacterium]
MKIIRQNNKNEKVSRMYGHTMKENSNKMIASPFTSIPKYRKSTHISTVAIERTNGCDEIRIIYNECGKDLRMISESAFKRTNIELEMDRNMLATFYEVNEKCDIREIKCDDLLTEIKDRFKNDVRYAYKGIHIHSPRNSRHRVYIYYLYTIIIATMSFLNSINFKMPIKISLEKNDAYLTLKIEMRVKNSPDLKNRAEVVKAPENETKFLYIDMLCKNNNIVNTFKLNDNKYVLKYEFCEVEKEEIKLYSKESDEESFFSKYMDIFNGKEISIEEV